MVVFFDLDGTVVGDATQIIPPSAIRAVEQLGKNGHLAVVNTGRPYGHIDPRIREMAVRGWICGCGMEIVLSGQWLYRATPAAEVCRQVPAHHVVRFFDALAFAFAGQGIGAKLGAAAFQQIAEVHAEA